MTASNPNSLTSTSKSGRRRRATAYFWPGFVAGFLVLSIFSCGGLMMATGISGLDLAELQEGGVAWIPPTMTPPQPIVQETQNPDNEEQAANPVDETAPGLFQAGDRVRNVTSSRVNIRAVPGYLGKPDGDVIAQTLPGETVEILGDRASADNLTWWRVRYSAPDGGTVEGWIAEATASGVQILGM